MILRSSSTWKTITADLALILFLVTAKALGDEQSSARQRESSSDQAQEGMRALDTSSALAMHRPSIGEDVRDWLAKSVTDERQVATIMIRYAPGRMEDALAEGRRLMAEAQAAGVKARLIARPDVRQETLITVDFLALPEDGTNVAG